MTTYRCGQWDGQQCKATKKLVACVMTVKEGNLLKGPDKVVVHLCSKHFKLNIPKRGRDKVGMVVIVCAFFGAMGWAIFGK